MDSIDDRQKVFEKIFKEHLKIETYSKSIESLFSPRLRNKINYKPYYQRNYVWDNNKATYFIESILLGTEIPPLIFFDNNVGIEVIDGRQRFETIQRFMENKFSLTPPGLNILKQLKKCSYDDLAKTDRKIIDSFLDSKLRIIEFQLVNEPPLDKHLEDRVKKEIFSRYNSGITPLRRTEIDNAVYDVDNLSNLFKDRLSESPVLKDAIYETFFKPLSGPKDFDSIAGIMSFIRRFLVLPMLPINYYADSASRKDLLSKLYQKLSDDSVDKEDEIADTFFLKTAFLGRVKAFAVDHNLTCNRLALECFLWGLGVLDQEEINYDLNEELVLRIANYIDSHIDDYTEQDYAFRKEVMTRYRSTVKCVEEHFSANLGVYVNANDEARERLRELRKPDDTITRLSELETLRLNKPEPSRNSIEDITRVMQRRRFLVRPSYQRKEVINPSKASAIIESVLLGITLPTLFIFKRKDGISEVIDGQQRILTLLGFIGADYVDENNQTVVSKNHRFPLRNLRILKGLERRQFSDLEDDQKNRIYDFQLYVVEIDENQNPNFDPIDLFIRLNDKPYPIREHSFEMWNSWVDIDIIQYVKDLAVQFRPWFFVKQLGGANDRDRMENEELLLSLAFLEYLKLNDPTRKTLDIYQKTERINARLSKKSQVSTVLQNVTETTAQTKQDFLTSAKQVKSFIRKLKYVLLDCDKTKDELDNYLKQELDTVFKAGKQARYFKRTKQDMYIAWNLLSGINFEMVKFKRLEIKGRLTEIFRYMKNIPKIAWQNNQGYQEFSTLCDSFKTDYKNEDRRLTLSESQKLELIRSQQNQSAITSAPIFLGDDIEVDHDMPLAVGGPDILENMSIVHQDENRAKGGRPQNKP